MRNVTKAMAAIAGLFLAGASAQAADLPDPDGKPADMSKKVKVFIIMGQSNTLEMGVVAGGKNPETTLEHAVKNQALYPFMVDDAGAWTVRKDVRNIHTQGSGGPKGRGGVRRNDWLTVSSKKIGIEQGIGHHLGNHFDEPVMILKSSIGNRSLGWDILPPGSPDYEYTEVNKKTKEEVVYRYAAYGENVLKAPKGGEGKAVNWTAGMQYDGDIARAKAVLADLEKHYPGATDYEVAGFLWWQGDKDRYNEGHAAMYERNLNALHAALRKEFNAPNAPMVVATLGQTDKNNTEGNEKMIIDGKFAWAAASPKDRAVFYSHPVSNGGASNGHYGGNAKTYMDVGLGMGAAMVELLK